MKTGEIRRGQEDAIPKEIHKKASVAHNMDGGRELGDAAEDVSQGNIMEDVDIILPLGAKKNVKRIQLLSARGKTLKSFKRGVDML